MKDLNRILSCKNKIAVYRELGGLGDILMHRMIFEDMKRLWPEVNVTFACPKKYHEAVRDHPFIDHVMDHKDIKQDEYLAVYDTSRSCYRTEMAQAPFVIDHRSDIWARTCGLELKNHRMHIRLTPEEILRADEIVPTKNLALIAPVTAMNSKNLDPDQVRPVERKLIGMGYDVFYIHDKDLEEYGRTVYGITVREMMAVVNKAALVVAADTACFHLAGGLDRPTVGVFGWADGFIYGRNYRNCQIVQKHRDYDPNWQCGPCFKFYGCEKCELKVNRKPCITEITGEMITDGIERLLNSRAL